MSEVALRPDVQHWSKADPADKEIVERVMAHVQQFERGIGVDFKQKCEDRYRQYRGFKRFRDAWTKTGPNDRDAVLYDAKKHWGAHLHIPMSYRTIETKVPRAIAHRPKLLYLPRQERWAENVLPVRLLIDSQQEQIDIDLPFQAQMRAGMIYGLGPGKSLWRKEYSLRRRVKQRMLRPTKYQVGELERVCTFNDPDHEDVDVFDFMWDPFGSDMKTAGWAVHRVWLSLEGCMDRVKHGMWNTVSAQALTVDDVRSMGSGQKYDEIWMERMEASGFNSFNLSVRGEQVHELLEFHDGQQVFTVLDRQVLVQNMESPMVGSMPFSVYRPTPLQKQMVGISELEPIEHLQRELDTLRSQRSDARTLALCTGYAYDDGAIEEEDLVFGPGVAIRVTNASPSQALMPLKAPDVPNSSFEDERVIRSDIDSVSGLADQPEGPTGTATEAQLVQAGLSRRIELQSRRFEIEVVRHVARCFLHLNQRMITEDRDPILQAEDGNDLAKAAEEGRWKWFPIGPAELQGEFRIIPEGGSMAAENVPQMRQDANALASLEGNPHIDPRRLVLKRLELLGIKDPDSWLAQQDAPIPPRMLQILEQMGVDKRKIDYAAQLAQESDPMLNGPNVEQVDQAMQEAQ